MFGVQSVKDHYVITAACVWTIATVIFGNSLLRRRASIGVLLLFTLLECAFGFTNVARFAFDKSFGRLGEGEAQYIVAYSAGLYAAQEVVSRFLPMKATICGCLALLGWVPIRRDAAQTSAASRSRTVALLFLVVCSIICSTAPFLQLYFRIGLPTTAGALQDRSVELDAFRDGLLAARKVVSRAAPFELATYLSLAAFGWWPPRRLRKEPSHRTSRHSPS